MPKCKECSKMRKEDMDGLVPTQFRGQKFPCQSLDNHPFYKGPLVVDSEAPACPAFVK